MDFSHFLRLFAAPLPQEALPLAQEAGDQRLLAGLMWRGSRTVGQLISNIDVQGIAGAYRHIWILNDL